VIVCRAYVPASLREELWQHHHVNAINQDEPRAIDAVGATESLLRVRRLERADAAQWRSLWEQYLRPTAESRLPGFYLQRPREQVIEATFARLVDPAQQPHAFVAVHADQLVGFLHYVFHPSTWSLTPVCYLEDLYVEPGMRRAGAGSALVRALYAAADEANAAAVYWVSHKSNTEGRGLFRTLARSTDFIRYER
jgi:GNAT superfamily N-acetyltransferase